MTLKQAVEDCAHVILGHVAMLNTDNNYPRRQEIAERLPMLAECLSKLVDIAERIKICGLDKEDGDAT